MHAQTWASYSALYRFGRFSPVMIRESGLTITELELELRYGAQAVARSVPSNVGRRGLR